MRKVRIPFVVYGGPNKDQFRNLVRIPAGTVGEVRGTVAPNELQAMRYRMRDPLYLVLLFRLNQQRLWAKVSPSVVIDVHDDQVSST